MCRSASSGFARKSGTVGATGGERQGPFAFSATVQGSANSGSISSTGNSSSTSKSPGTGGKYSKGKAEISVGSGRKFSKSRAGSSSGSEKIGGQKGKSIRLGGRRGENKVKAAYLRSK